MSVSVKPKGVTYGDASDSTPKSRTWHPYSDKMIGVTDRRDKDRWNLRRELARNDRTLKRLRDKRKQGRVFYT